MTTLGIPATGYSICYELGIFKQKIVDGQQVELADNWKDLGEAWLMPKPQETEEVHFGGTGPGPLGQRPPEVVYEDGTGVSGRALRHGDRRLRHPAGERPAAVGRQESQARSI